MRHNFSKAASILAKITNRYLASEDFMNDAREVIDNHMSNGVAYLHLLWNLRAPIDARRDKAAMETAFAKVKAEYPFLDHMRLSGVYLVFDTKPNTWRRRNFTTPLPPDVTG